MSTKIEWTDETWNPVTGCTKVSQGCKNCYAERLAPKVFAGQTVRVDVAGERKRDFTDVWMHPERLDVPLHWRKPRRIFVNSMSDLFHEDVPENFIDEIFAVMAISNQHKFQILTKRPERMLNYLRLMPLPRRRWENIMRRRGFAHLSPPPILPHVWLGVSVEDQPTADERIPLLLQTPAAVRFVSYEPALGPIDLDSPDADGLHALGCGDDICQCGDRGIDWLIAGGESGPKARPSHPDWFRSVRNQCAAAGVPFFFKQWGEWAPVGTLEVTKTNRGASELAIRNHRGPLFFPGHDYCFQRVGKRAAGRLLDGREHSEYPT